MISLVQPFQRWPSSLMTKPLWNLRLMLWWSVSVSLQISAAIFHSWCDYIHMQEHMWCVQLLTEKLKSKSSKVPQITNAPKAVTPSEKSALYYTLGCHIRGQEGRLKLASPAKHSKAPSHLRQGVESVDKRMRQFTEKQNRGGLVFAGTTFYQFSHALYEILKGERLIWN